jgi:hypothetical protein
MHTLKIFDIGISAALYPSFPASSHRLIIATKEVQKFFGCLLCEVYYPGSQEL